MKTLKKDRVDNGNYIISTESIICGGLDPEVDELSSKCHLGISISNPNFWGERLRAVLEWINANFSECHMVLGGYLYRHNDIIFSDHDTSLDELSRRRDEQYLESNERYISEYSHIVKISRSEDFIVQGRYHGIYKEFKQSLDRLYNTSDKFRQLTRDTAESFLDRSKKRGRLSSLPREAAVIHSVEFILEELSIYCVLIDQKWPVEVYPGPELPVLRACLNDEIPEAPDPLTQRINIQIDVKESKETT